MVTTSRRYDLRNYALRYSHRLAPLSQPYGNHSFPALDCAAAASPVIRDIWNLLEHGLEAGVVVVAGGAAVLVVEQRSAAVRVLLVVQKPCGRWNSEGI